MLDSQKFLETGPAPPPPCREPCAFSPGTRDVLCSSPSSAGSVVSGICHKPFLTSLEACPPPIPVFPTDPSRTACGLPPLPTLRRPAREPSCSEKVKGRTGSRSPIPNEPLTLTPITVCFSFKLAFPTTLGDALHRKLLPCLGPTSPGGPRGPRSRPPGPLCSHWMSPGCAPGPPLSSASWPVTTHTPHFPKRTSAYGLCLQNVPSPTTSHGPPGAHLIPDTATSHGDDGWSLPAATTALTGRPQLGSPRGLLKSHAGARPSIAFTSRGFHWPRAAAKVPTKALETRRPVRYFL